MRITIAQRLRPFSHTPGTYCLLPGSFLRFQIFPTRIVIDDLSGPLPQYMTLIDFSLRGPVKDFTIQQDLEKGNLRVWGYYQEGFFRYNIFSGKDPKAFIFEIEKCPHSGVKSETFKRTLQAKENLCFSNGNIVSENLPLTIKEQSRLSLGCHKAQNWDQVQKRADPIEIFPFWCRLGKMIPKSPFTGYQGTLKLLERCNTLIEEGKKLEIYKAFINVFHAGFEGILSPRLIDVQHHGFDVGEPEEGFQGSSLLLLTEGEKLISKLFIQTQDQQIKICPVLPPEFHSGRMVAIDCGHLGQVDIEWSKKTIRRMLFRSDYSGSINFIFQKKVKSYRLRTSKQDKGQRVKVDKPIDCQQEKTYLFDNFQK